MITLGKRISTLPYIVAKLSDPANLFAVYLYNALQTDSSRKVQRTEREYYYILNNQATLIQKYYADFIVTFDKLADEWVAHHASLPALPTRKIT